MFNVICKDGLPHVILNDRYSKFHMLRERLEVSAMFGEHS